MLLGSDTKGCLLLDSVGICLLAVSALQIAGGEYSGDYGEETSYPPVKTGDYSENGYSPSGSGDSSDEPITEFEQSGDAEVYDGSGLDVVHESDLEYEEDEDNMLALEIRKYYHDIHHLSMDIVSFFPNSQIALTFLHFMIL